MSVRGIDDARKINASSDRQLAGCPGLSVSITIRGMTGFDLSRAALLIERALQPLS